MVGADITATYVLFHHLETIAKDSREGPEELKKQHGIDQHFYFSGIRFA